MKNFKASVTYGDLKGSVAADRADMTDASRWLAEQELLSDNESVVGIRMWVGENHGKHQDPVSVTFLVLELNGYDNFPEMIKSEGENLNIKEITVGINIADFLALFKRFEITLSSDGLLEGTTYNPTE